MAVTYGFYNAIDGDRTYDAEDMSQFFDGIFTDGIFVNFRDALAVTPSTGMAISVGIGRAWFDHTWTYNNAPLILNIRASDQILSRIDAVVIEVNKTTAIRANDIKIVEGVAASVPEKPAMIDAQDHKQYPLAYITVAPGVTEIGASAIEDNRGKSTCPYAASVIDNTDLIIQNVLQQFQQSYANEIVYNGLDYVVQGKVLDARQGKTLNDKIADIRTSFQDGCNALVAACTSNGYAPASNSIAAIVSAINNIRGRVVLYKEGEYTLLGGGTYNLTYADIPAGAVVIVVSIKRGKGWNGGAGDHTGVFYQINFGNFTYLYNPGTTGHKIIDNPDDTDPVNDYWLGCVIAKANAKTDLYLQLNGEWRHWLIFLAY